MTDRKRIEEVIVVEGRHDTEKLKKYFDCDTIETGGTHLGKDILEQIRYAKQSRGVIIFTDPDVPGTQIRHRINEAVPGCKNAFVLKKDAHTTKKVGVEHANNDVLREALENCATFTDYAEETITVSDMQELGLTGEGSTEKREVVGAYFHIGMGNAKTMRKRLNGLHINKDMVKEALEKNGR